MTFAVATRVVSVPEPASFSLLIAGLIPMFARRRRINVPSCGPWSIRSVSRSGSGHSRIAAPAPYGRLRKTCASVRFAFP
jgi:hypothetical protein